MLVFEYGMTGSSVDSSVVVRLSCTGASSGCFRGSKSVTPDVSELLDLAVCFGPKQSVAIYQLTYNCTTTRLPQNRHNSAPDSICEEPATTTQLTRNASTKAKTDRVRQRVHIIQRAHPIFSCAVCHAPNEDRRGRDTHTRAKPCKTRRDDNHRGAEAGAHGQSTTRR